MVSALQCREARSLLGISQEQLAEVVGVPPVNVLALERGHTIRANAKEAIRRSLEKAGIEFVEQDYGGLILRLRTQKS